MKPARCGLFLVVAVITISARGNSPARADEKPKPQPAAIEKLLGSSKEAIRSELGTPDRMSNDWDSFFKAGVTVDYNEAGKVKKVSASQFVSDDIYKGKVLGIALGDSKKDCVTAWRDPVKTAKTILDYERVTWHHMGYVLEVEVWKEDGDEKIFAKRKKDTVKRITISKKTD
jgi:hypothetical protein